MKTFRQTISCNDLHTIIDRDNLILLDASIPPVGNITPPKQSWPACKIPGARRFNLNRDFSDLDSTLPHTMPSAKQFEKAAQLLGIRKNSQIIVYDDLGLFSAARAWYMFKAMGHKNIAVLDGGMAQWLALKKPIEIEQKLSHVTRGDFTACFDQAYFCNWQEVESNIALASAVVIDARAARRFIGLDPEPRAGMRSGHIPKAKNLPFTFILNNGLLKTREELIAIFQQLNPESKPMIMSCGSGVTACILVLAANISGYDLTRVYDGSWSEWGASETLPIELEANS